MRFDGPGELAAATFLTVAGAAMAAAGPLAHLPWLVAPGASALVLGAGWLGVALARRELAARGEGAREQGGEGR